MPLPPAPADGGRDLRELPGGVSNTTHGEGVRRGVGYAVGIKNVGFSEGFDDYSTARVRLSIDGGEPLVEVHTAAVEVGQGLVTVQAQIARTELGVERVAVLTADTRVGSAGSSSASRQTYVTGGAVKAACEAVRERLGCDPRTMTADELAELLGDDAIEETVEWHHRETYPLDENGQGDAHLQFAFSAHRAVVDVDLELGLVRVVELATAQEVGKAMNPQALEGQIQGGTAQGLGLALFEEIQVKDGRVLNASFTDYLLPTILDMPPMRIEILEHADPEAPYGLKGVGEPPHISTPPAVVAALRAASGRPLTRIPVRPEHIVGLEPARAAARDQVPAAISFAPAAAAPPASSSSSAPSSRPSSTIGAPADVQPLERRRAEHERADRIGDPGARDPVDPPQREVGELAGPIEPSSRLAPEAAGTAERRQRQRLASGERLRPVAHARDEQRLVELVDHPAGLVRGGAIDAQPDGTRARVACAAAPPRRRAGRSTSGSAPPRFRSRRTARSPRRRGGRSAPSTRRRRASRAARRTAPACSRTARGRTPPRRRLGEMRVQPHAGVARELCRVAHQLLGDRERRARRDRDPDHRVLGWVVPARDRCGRLREDLVVLLDDRIGWQPPRDSPRFIDRAQGGSGRRSAARR